jgi:hypothetical protein
VSTTEREAVAEVLRQNRDLLAFHINEYVNGANRPDLAEAAVANDREFVSALDQAADLLDEPVLVKDGSK